MEGTRTITMKTNFEGLIYLLADGLYSRYILLGQWHWNG